MGTPNWSRLFLEGRCKAIGVPFSDEELEMIKNGVSAKEIQEGKFDKEEKQEFIGDEKEIKKQLRQTLRDKGIGFTNFDSLETLQAKLK